MHLTSNDQTTGVAVHYAHRPNHPACQSRNPRGIVSNYMTRHPRTYIKNSQDEPTDGDTRNLKSPFSCAAATRHEPQPCINVPQTLRQAPPPRPQKRGPNTHRHVAGCLKQHVTKRQRRRKYGWVVFVLFTS